MPELAAVRCSRATLGGDETLADAPRPRRSHRGRREEGEDLLSLTLLCSDAAYGRDGNEWETIVPGLRTVLLTAAGRISDDQLAGIDIAFFSADCYPERTASFLRIATDAPNLRWMHLFNAGVDHPVFTALRQRGVRLTTSSGSSAVPIAHSVMLHLLAMCRAVRTYEANQRQHRWQPGEIVDVEGRTVGVVGLGAIGAEVARLAAHFGMRVIGLRRTPSGDEPCETWPSSRLDELLPLVDDLVLAAPLSDETRNMIGTAQIAAMKPGAHVVNVGRGEVIDEQALIDALRSGQVGAAALDVFAVEPLPDDSPLWDLPNVTITPHAAGGTELSKRRADEMFTDNLRRFTSERDLRNEVP